MTQNVVAIRFLKSELPFLELFGGELGERAIGHGAGVGIAELNKPDYSNSQQNPVLTMAGR